MDIDLRKRNFIALKDFSEKEILYLIDLAWHFKDLKQKRKLHKYLEGQNIILLFEEASTRTRTSFEIAAADLGMSSSFINYTKAGLGENESIEDTILVFDRYYDGIVYRGHEQDLLEKLVKITDVPIYNAMTDMFHPSQMISDMLTIREKFGHLKGLKLAYLGYPGDIMPNSLAITCSKLGIDFVGCGPREFFPGKALVNLSRKFSDKYDSDVIYTEDIRQAVKDADIIYTDMWLALTEKNNPPIGRIRKLYPYRVTDEVMAMCDKDAIFMHCLPAFHDHKSNLAKKVLAKFPDDMKDCDFNGMEVTDSVFRSEKSMVFDQTENRIPAVKAILYSTLRLDSDLDLKTL
ncbi:ornithine carbamoyltransferase [uncultured Anaerococcus sp.]|uniref:ornithine carbamoyltransferase n=1 Tax=uncultured Anaerococcus sp. TaxID=293428 RepID=UPI00261B532E|nr:ornithine carbamoyltransferase [uncultured Anaerococcus sp.]